MRKNFSALVLLLFSIIFYVNMSYGSEIFKEVLRANGMSVIEHGDKAFSEAHQKKIDNIGQRLLKELGVAQINRGKEYGEWGFYIIDSGSKPNAFGSYRGVGVDGRLVKELSDDELAFVIAHEIAHVVLKHSEQPDMGARERMEKIRKRDLKELGKEMKERTGRIPRAEERAADNLAMTFMVQANFNPEGAIKFFQRGLKDEGLSERAPEFVRRLYHAFSTHPTYRERNDTAVKWVNEYRAREAINELHNLRQRLADIKEPPKTALAPTDKLTGLDQKAGQQQLTPVKDMPFTQTFSGPYEKPSSSPYNVAVYSNTGEGFGTRSGVAPGNFSANYSITATSTENNTFSAYSSGTFSSTMSGTVSGFKEGTLKGTGNMNMTAGTTGGTNFNFSGPVTIEPSGKLTFGTSGTFTLGNNSGTTTGTWTQTPK